VAAEEAAAAKRRRAAVNAQERLARQRHSDARTEWLAAARAACPPSALPLVHAVVTMDMDPLAALPRGVAPYSGYTFALDLPGDSTILLLLIDLLLDLQDSGHLSIDSLVVRPFPGDSRPTKSLVVACRCSGTVEVLVSSMSSAISSVASQPAFMWEAGARAFETRASFASTACPRLETTSDYTVTVMQLVSTVHPPPRPIAPFFSAYTIVFHSRIFWKLSRMC
jgi:hypothetical protein